MTAKYETAMQFVNEITENHPQDIWETVHMIQNNPVYNALGKMIGFSKCGNVITLMVKHKTACMNIETYEIVF